MCISTNDIPFELKNTFEYNCKNCPPKFTINKINPNIHFSILSQYTALKKKKKKFIISTLSRYPEERKKYLKNRG